MKILTLLFVILSAAGVYAQIDYLPPHQVKNITRLSQLIDSSGSCKIGSFRLYFQSEGQDLQVAENKGDVFNPQILKMLKYAKIGDVFRFVRIKNLNCKGITDTFSLHIQASKPPRVAKADEMQKITSLDELFEVFPHKNWQTGCNVSLYRLYYHKLRQDPVEIVSDKNIFDGNLEKAVQMAAKGDFYIFMIEKSDCGLFSTTIYIE